MAEINLNLGEPNKVQEVEKPRVEILDEDLNKEYTDTRSITISLVHNYSNYRKANMKVLGQKVEVIGSSVSSSRILSSNEGEVKAYFPALIGLSPNNPEFISRVKAWLNNIRYVISNNDATLDISFVYKTKKDYLDFLKREEAIERKFDKADRSNTNTIEAAVKTKVEELNALESEKYRVGRPVNVEQYLLYRHCLLYKDVAKDIALINSDASLRFYIKDENKEAEKQKKMAQERLTAMRNFIELGASEAKFRSIYIAIVILRNDNLADALLKPKHIQETIVMDFVNNNPDKFNKMFKDANISMKAFIETLIVRGELVRSDVNQQISTAEGVFIGSNMTEAIAYFKNPANKDVYDSYQNKLKMF